MIDHTLVLAAIGTVLGIVTVSAGLRHRVERSAAAAFAAWRLATLADETVVSTTRSQAVLRGQIAEHLVAMSPGEAFAFDLADARYLGQPIDYIVFNGYTEVRAGRRDRLHEIVLVDIKTGRASLSTVQRRIKACVEAGRVRFVVLRPIEAAR